MEAPVIEWQPARPWCKAAGGKTRLLPEIKKLLPDKFNTYYEPFVGGGALFFDLVPKHAVLNDANKKLMVAYRVVRDEVEALIKRLKKMPYDKVLFERVRARNFDGNDPVQNAADFIYCNKTCFNGLYRVNQSGQFNVPFGRYDNPTICDADNLRACAIALKGTRIHWEDFATALVGARKGDLVYADCPYAPLSKTSNFTGFTPGGFTNNDQTRLRDCALELKKRGVHVVLSNSAAPLIYNLYKRREFKIVEIHAARAINSDGFGRDKIKELLIY